MRSRAHRILRCARISGLRLPPAAFSKPNLTFLQAQLAPEAWDQQGEEFQRSAVWSISLADRTKLRLKSFVQVNSLTLAPHLLKLSVRRAVTCSAPCQNVNNSLLLVQGRVFAMYYRYPFVVRKSAEVYVRHAKTFDERQTEKFSHLRSSGRRLISSSLPTFSTHLVSLQHPWSMRKNARVCVTDKIYGFTVPLFKMVMEHSVHVFFEVHEKAPRRFYRRIAPTCCNGLWTAHGIVTFSCLFAQDFSCSSSYKRETRQVLSRWRTTELRI